MAPRWLVPLLLVAPLPVLAGASVHAADWAAKRAAVTLDRVVKSASHSEPGAKWVYVEPEVELPVSVAPERASNRPIARKLPLPKKGVRVRAETVLRLANSGARPSGIPVPAHGERPAGLALSGVSGLGIGLVDGDVLTHADGRPARSAGDVIGVVIGARAQKAPEICGRFWRGGEPWNLIVEQPYLRRRPAPAPGG